MGKEVNIDGKCYLILSWYEVCELAYSLADKIEEQQFKPNLIVGIFRGGMTIAHILSDRLGVYDIRGIGARIYQKIGEIKEKLEIYQPLPLKDLIGYNVVLVDDVVDTGTTYKGILRDEIWSKNPRRLCTTSLHIKPWAEYRPDIYMKETTCWICYPWESWQVGLEIFSELMKKHDLETARKVLNEQFEVDPSIVGRIAESAQRRRKLSLK